MSGASGSKNLTPEQRSIRARIAAHARWKSENPMPNAKRGQEGLVQKFLEEIRAEHPHLPEKELRRRAISARNEYLARLAYERTKARTNAKADSE